VVSTREQQLEQRLVELKAAYEAARMPLEDELVQLHRRRFIRGIPWEKHDRASLGPMPFHPVDRLLLEELVPEPQLGWMLEVMVEYYGIGSSEWSPLRYGPGR
jgi:hypothetical protein